MDRWNIYGASLGSTKIGAITQCEYRTGTETGGEPVSGSVHPVTQYILAQKPGASLTTLALSTALGAISQLGVGLHDAPLVLYYIKHEHGGARDVSGHKSVTFRDGLLVPRQLSCAHGADADLSLEAFATYDGVNEPLIFSTAALPTGFDDAQRYGLGPVLVGNVPLTGVRQVDIDFGLTVEPEGGNGEVWDRFVSVVEAKPVVTLRGIDLNWLGATTFPLGGRIALHTNTSIYFLRRATGGTYVSDASAAHVRVSCSGLAYVERGGGDGGSAAENTLTMPLFHDGTNLPLVINAGVIIN